MYDHEYAQKWLPALGDATLNRLREPGARLAEIGCGTGVSTRALAKAFPQARVDGIDIDSASIDAARALTKADPEVKGNLEFHATTAESFGHEGEYDYVSLFECLHDMAYPTRALKAARKMLKPEGVLLVSDEKVPSSLASMLELGTEDNMMGKFFYGFSVLHCLPVAIDQAVKIHKAEGKPQGNGMALGTAGMTARKMQEMAKEAGFGACEVATNNAFWRFWKLTP